MRRGYRLIDSPFSVSSDEFIIILEFSCRFRCFLIYIENKIGYNGSRSICYYIREREVFIMAFLDKLNNFAKNIGDKTSEVLETNKLNGKINGEQKAIAEEIRKLGEYYYEKHTNGEALDEGASAICCVIDEHNQVIRDTQAEIERIKEAAAAAQQARTAAAQAPAPEDILDSITCPACGTINMEGNNFCSQCGTSLLPPEPEENPEEEPEQQEVIEDVEAEAEPEPEPLTKTCPSCGTILNADAKFCTQCGTKTED